MHPCPQCGRELEAGIPFCSQCGAPQIRVSMVDPPSSDPVPGASVELHRKSEPISSPSQRKIASDDLAIDWPLARSRASIAGIIMVLVMMYPPLGGLFFICMPLGGALAVFLYARKRRTSYVSLAAGTRIGVIAGFVAFTISAALLAGTFAIEHFAMHRNKELVGLFRVQIEQAIAVNPDPQVRQMAQVLLTPDGMALVVVLGMVFVFVMFLVLCGLGGMLGSMVFTKRSGRG
jgi:zinc-ribbon domain